MDQFRFRIPAKIISIVCLVLLSLAALSVAVAVVAVVTVIATTSSQVPESSQREEEGADIFLALFGFTIQDFSILICILFVILVLSIVFQFIGSIKLLQASSPKADPEIALGQANYCLIVFCFFGTIAAVQELYAMAWGKLICTVVIDGFCIFIVWKFTQELKAAIGRNISKV